MPNQQLVHPSELREIDRFYDSLPNKSDFVDQVQTPSRLAKLHIAVAHLVAYWPTLEEINSLRAAAKALDRYTLADRTVIDDLESVRVLEVIGGFNPANGDAAVDAELFNKLHRERPRGRAFYDKYNYLEDMDEVMTKIFAIAVM